MANEIEHEDMFSVLLEAFYAFSKSADKLSKAYNQLSQDTKINKTIKTSSYYSSALFDLVCGSLECIKDGIIILDRSGRIIFFNKVAQEIMNLDPLDTVGKSHNEIFHNDLLLESVENGIEKNYKRRFDNGKEFDVIIRPIKGGYGRIIGAVEILSSMNGTLYNEQKQESDYIAKLVKAMGDIVKNIVHHLRSPLGAIQLFAEILKEDLNDDKVVMVDEILSSVYSLDGILSNLLSSVQPLNPSFQRVDLINAIEESLAFAMPAIRQQNIQLIKNYNSKGLYCYVDLEQLKQVFFNIILNAIQAMPEGGNLMIKASYSDNAENIYIEIEDSGYGIPNELMDRVWMPFFTTKEGGTGLGLYVVYRIIHIHKGKIDIKSVDGIGTKITIKLPTNLNTNELDSESV
ncbi:MAG: two-component system sensor histidine kinase NtrB [Candidatus Poribacteria bacterium]